MPPDGLCMTYAYVSRLMLLGIIDLRLPVEYVSLEFELNLPFSLYFKTNGGTLRDMGVFALPGGCNTYKCAFQKGTDFHQSHGEEF